MSRPKSPVHSLSATEKRAIVLELLTREGYNQNESADLMNLSRQRVHIVNKQLKQGTLTPLVAKAKKSIKTLLEGKPVGAMTEVRGSDILGAAKMVMERAEPVVQKIEQRNLSLSVDLTSDERERYKQLLGVSVVKAIEGEFEPVQELPASNNPEPQKLLNGGDNENR